VCISGQGFYSPRRLRLLLAILLVTVLIGLVPSPAASWASSPVVSLYDSRELVFHTSTLPANPFDTYLLRLEVTPPAGQSFAVDGFYAGEAPGNRERYIWKARLAFDQVGRWRWRTVAGDTAALDPSLIGLSGTVDVVDQGGRGGVVADGRYFRYQNGEYVYLVGNFLDFADGLPSTHVLLSEALTGSQREAVFARQQAFHTVNKVNLYLANVGDYGALSVTPWQGTASAPDTAAMNLERWDVYAETIQRFQSSGIIPILWFFADDSQFGALAPEARHRLLRYAMARTSAFHTMYVIALEWQETYSAQQIQEMGQYLQTYNPWQRPVSVHSLTLSGWEFDGDQWPSFIASQAGTDATAAVVNQYALQMRAYLLPHLSEEFGILNQDSDAHLRANLWANFLGGAAGSGTGSDLRALRRFLAESQAPFWQLEPANQLVEEGGLTRFALAQPGAHYVVYSLYGEFEVEIVGSDLRGYWFNPRDPEATLSEPFPVEAGRQRFRPPSTDADWVLWITTGPASTA
jgi:hypothetical protein